MRLTVDEVAHDSHSRLYDVRRRLKVVSIAHPAFGDGSSRFRYYPLTDRPGLELTLIIPDRWSETGQIVTKGTEAGPLKIRNQRVVMRELPRLGWYAHFYPGMARCLRELSPDIIHLWEEPWSIVALQAAILRDRLLPNAALILETEQNILRRLPQPFEFIRRFTLHKADLLIARQREALDVSIACGYQGPSTLVEYVIDQRVFQKQDRVSCREEFGIDSFCIGYVGRILRAKGLFTVLRALEQCSSPVCFICMGSGKDQDAFIEEVACMGLSDRVRLLPYASPARVARFMGAIDALVLMSETTATWKEQFGRVIIEAQACGTPVIGSDSGAIPHVIGQGGWIVSEKDAAGLVELLNRLASSPDDVAAAASKARRNVERFGPEIVAESLETAFVTAHNHRASAVRG